MSPGRSTMIYDVDNPFMTFINHSDGRRENEVQVQEQMAKLTGGPSKSIKEAETSMRRPHRLRVEREGRDLSSVSSLELCTEREVDQIRSEPRVPQPSRPVLRVSTTDTPDKPSMWCRQFISVWSRHCRGYEVNFGGGFFHVATRTGSTHSLVFLQKHGTSPVSERVNFLKRNDSARFVQCLGCFDASPEVYFAFEPMLVSLLQVSSALRSPSEQELVVIASQVRKLQLLCPSLMALACGRC